MIRRSTGYISDLSAITVISRYGAPAPTKLRACLRSLTRSGSMTASVLAATAETGIT
jgi:hypothetical protein